jgi:hypothetical protein
MNDEPPQRIPLAYDTPVPRQVRRRPYAGLAIITGILTVVILLLAYFKLSASGRRRGSLDEAMYTRADDWIILRTFVVLCFAWFACVGGIIWSVRNERRRARVLRNARVDPLDARRAAIGRTPPK